MIEVRSMRDRSFDSCFRLTFHQAENCMAD